MPNLTPRTFVALGIGLVAFVALSSLLRDPELGAGFFEKPPPPIIVSTGTVTSGDVLAKILEREGLDRAYIYPIQTSLATVLNLSRDIHPGDRYELTTSTSGIFQQFVFMPDPIRKFLVSRSSSGVYTADVDEMKTVWIEKRVSCEVQTNMNNDLIRAGYDPALVAPLVVELADNIFAWRIDFFTEQRQGDRLTALAEFEYPLGGDKPIPGRVRVLAATYEGSGTRHKNNVAIRYAAPGESRAEYFDEDGEAVRKAFLRAPFTHGAFRISSRYNPRRLHPIKRIYRPHHGVDYAAATGTPVASVGNGRVTFAGWKGGYGNCVEIRHSGKYTSRYGHLSRINVRTGQAVNQGSLVGRVGSTGLATGPHLHFEMHVDGHPQNFLRLNFPAAKSVSATDLAAFKQVRDVVMGRLRGDTALVSDLRDASSQIN